VIGRTAAAQTQAEEEQPPPTEKATVVLDHGLEAGVRQLVQPVRQLGEEVPDRFKKGAGQGYDLPRWRRRAVTCVRIRARVS
jgi:hypothetical protein